MSPPADERPYLAGNRVWLLVALAAAVAIVAIAVVVWWDLRATDNRCDKLDQRVVTNQEEADEVFDEKAAAGCLSRD